MYIVVAVVVGLCCVPFIWSDCFFERQTTIAEKLMYVGAFIGGILLVINAYQLYRRNNLIAKGQLDIRFKDAATLLAAGNPSAELSGVHALHQIAIEASKTEDQKDYVGVIKDILITFIKEKSVVEFRKDETVETTYLSEIYSPTLRNAENRKTKTILQTIIDKLFRDKDCEIYTKYPTDLSNTALREINFSKAKLQGVNFDMAQLQGANFYSSVDIDKAVFSNVFWDKETKFEKTAFENKTIEELTKIMGRPPM